MAKETLMDFIRERTNGAEAFTPYSEYSKEADALTVRVKPDADYTKRLTDHVTVFLSLDNDQIVGCRIKGVSSLLEDLPNYVRIGDDYLTLSVIFLSFRGGVEDQSVRETFNELARVAGSMKLQHG